MTDVEILEQASRYVGIRYVNGVEDPYINPCLLKAIDTAITALRAQQEHEHYGDDAEGRLNAICEQCQIGYSDRLFLRDLLDAWEAECERDNPKPLTLDELREVSEEDEFGGTHIWIKDLNNGWIASAITDITTQDGVIGIWCADANDVYREKDYGKTWLAYRYKPKEAQS